jgi:hypothetical protein
MMVDSIGDIGYDPSNPRNSVLKDLWSQVQLMRIHKEVQLMLIVLPDELKDSEFEMSLQELSIRCQRKLLPEFAHNPLLELREGTVEWHNAMKSIHFTYMQL